MNNFTSRSNTLSPLFTLVSLVVAALLAHATVSRGQTVWTENFEGFSLGDLASQDATWTSIADPLLTTSSLTVATGKTLRIDAGGPGGIGHQGQYAYKDLNAFGITGNTITLDFRMLHEFNPNVFQGKFCEFGFLSAAKGLMFQIEYYDSNIGTFINGNPVTAPTAHTFHDYSLVIDFEFDSFTMVVDGTTTHGPFALIGSQDWTPFDLVTSGTSGLYWVAGMHFNNGTRSTHLLVDDIVLSQQDPIPAIWIENFESYALGDLLLQSSDWSQSVSPLITASSLDVVAGQRLHFMSTALGGSLETRNTAYRDLANIPVTQDQVVITFSMEHTFAPPSFQGKMSGVTCVSSTQGIMFEMLYLDNPSFPASMNNVQFNFPPAGSHDYELVIDFATDTIALSIDSAAEGTYPLLGAVDWTPADWISTAPDTGLAWFCGFNFPNAQRTNTLYVDNIMVFDGLDGSGGDLQIDADIRSLVAGRSLFDAPDDHIRWDDIPIPGINAFAAVTALNRSTPVSVTTANAGYLYALLWRWDFGILAHDWTPLPALHGWTLVDPDGGEALNFFNPVSPLPLYRRPLSAGVHSVTVTEDVGGQWVLAGFVEDAGAVGDTNLSTATLLGGATKYNVFDPGETVTVQSADTILALRLGQNQQPLQAIGGTPFAAPQQPGRYWLEIDFANGTRVMPLTVGLGPVTQAGWTGSDFFPIHFYGAGGGDNSVNPQLGREVSILAQFDLGCNTFRVNHLEDASLIDALGGRRYYNTVTLTRFYIRDVVDDGAALGGFQWSLEQFYSNVANEVGFYVEDEPPPTTASRMNLVEQQFATDYAGTNLRMVYTLNSANLSYWQTANPSTGGFRAYPFYLSDVGNIPVMNQSLDDRLLNGIATWRSFDPTTPLWLTTQVFGDDTWAVPSVEQVRVQINLALARGVEALTHFGWAFEQVLVQGVSRWPYVPVDGRYAELGELHATINSLEMHKWDWVADVPQTNTDFDVQRMTNAQGGPVAWITNRDWTSAHAGTVDLPGHAQPYAVSLDPGDSEVVTLCPTLTADLTGDCSVDQDDLTSLHINWLAQVGAGNDVDGSGVFDLADFSHLAAQWGQTVVVP
jgi:hypothetical protein